MMLSWIADLDEIISYVTPRLIGEMAKQQCQVFVW